MARGGSTDLSKRVRVASSHFGTAQRILWLGRLFPAIPRLLKSLQEPPGEQRSLSILGISLGAILFIIDDFITMDRLGVLPRGWITARTWRMAAAAWFGTTLCALCLNRRQMKALEGDEEHRFQYSLSRIAEMKLVMDMGSNVPYTIGQNIISKLPDGYFAFCGFAAGNSCHFNPNLCQCNPILRQA